MVTMLPIIVIDYPHVSLRTTLGCWSKVFCPADSVRVPCAQLLYCGSVVDIEHQLFQTTTTTYSRYLAGLFSHDYSMLVYFLMITPC